MKTAAVCLVLALLPCAAAQAQTFPAKPVRLIVPFPAGGSTDVLARLVAEKLGEALGQQVIVDNRPGANGTIGTEMVAKAAPDGYTLLMAGIGTLAINSAIYSKISYDPVKDFAPITQVAAYPTYWWCIPRCR